MCTALEQWIQKEFKKGEKQGLEKGEKRGLEKGEKRGLEKGLEQGEKRGLEKGLVQGEKRGLEKRDRELILKWTAAGYQTAMIADLLGLSEEEVRKVQNEKTMVDVC